MTKLESCNCQCRRSYSLFVFAPLLLAILVLLSSTQAQGNGQDQEVALRVRLESSPKLPFRGVFLLAHSSSVGWQSGSVSAVTIGAKGDVYEIQRGDSADPILHLNSNGRLLDSWGKGDFTIPHSIRLDPAGNVWTVDAGSSTVIEWSPKGRKLKSIAVGEQPTNGSSFNGATDVAFGPNGLVYITDGYGNARVLIYDANGKQIKQWGVHGTLPGQFDLPHAIQVGTDGTIYVADRENDRIEKFNLDGTYIGQIAHLGRVYAIKFVAGTLWASVGPPDQPPGSPGGWIVKLDAKTGQVLGHLDVAEGAAGHSIDVTSSGEPVITVGNGLLWFHAE